MTSPGTAMAGKRLDLKMAKAARPWIACYFPLGDDRFDDAVRDAYHAGGADILELGIPSRNPFMDGPDVAGTMARAFETGTDAFSRLDEMLDWLSADPGRPAAVAMGYAGSELDGLFEPERLGRLDGALLLGRLAPDQPSMLAASGTHRCGFVSAAIDAAELAAAREASGYVMLQAASGVTGPRRALDEENGAKIRRLRDEGVEAPILLGFGISEAEQAKQAIDLGADGIVVGSMCVRQALKGSAALQDYLGGLRNAVDG